LEAGVSTENWTEERERLVRLLEAIEAGKITHVNEDDLRQLQATSDKNIAALRARLAKLNLRLGEYYGSKSTGASPKESVEPLREREFMRAPYSDRLRI
jgi:hypothetical protein